MKIKYIFLIIIMTSVILPLSAQDTFLIGNSARSAGIADAGIAMPSDLNVMNFNPAGLGYIKQMQAALIHEEWIDTINIESGSFCMHLSGIGTFGANIEYLYMPDFEIFNRNGESQGKANASDMDLTAGFGMNLLSPSQFVGINLKYLQQNLSEYSASSIAVDLGYLTLLQNKIASINEIKAGMVLKNAGANLSKAGEETSDMPMRLGFGLSGNLINIQGMQNHRLYLATELLMKLSGESGNKIHTGLEYGFKDFLYLRAGYKAGYTAKGLTSGMGLNYYLPNMTLSLNYSMLFNQYFNNNHILELVIKFNDNRKPAVPQEKQKTDEEKVEEIEKEFDILLEEDNDDVVVEEETTVIQDTEKDEQFIEEIDLDMEEETID